MRAASRPLPSQTANSRALSVSGCNSSPGRRCRARPETPRPSSPVPSERMRTEPPSNDCGLWMADGGSSGSGARSSDVSRTMPVSGVHRSRVLAGLVTCSSSAGVAPFVRCASGSACRAWRPAGRRRRRRTDPARAAADRVSGRVPAGRRCRTRPAPSRAPAAHGWNRRPARRNPCRTAESRLCPARGQGVAAAVDGAIDFLLDEPVERRPARPTASRATALPSCGVRQSRGRSARRARRRSVRS